MVLSVQLTKEDLFQFNYYTSWKAPEHRKKRLKYYLRNALGGLALLLVLLLIRENKDLTLLLIWTGIYFLVLLITIPFWIKRHYRKHVEAYCSNPQNSSFFEKAELTIDETGILSRDSVSSASHLWPAFTREVETEDYFYLYLNSLAGLVIPKRSFASLK